MSRLLKSTGAVGAATLISRVLGFVREAVYAGFMGVGPVADAFYYAYSIPNLFRRLLGEGALTAAFIPIFKEREKTAGEAVMWDSARAVFSALLLLCGAVVVVAMIGLTGVLAWIPLGGQAELIVRLMRLMFPYLLFVCMTAVFIGILNARGHFFMPALGASLLNVVMIAAVFLIAPGFGSHLDSQVFGLAVGVLLAGLVQAVFQYPALHREGFRFRWVNPIGNPTVKEVIQRMAPATLGVAAYQFNVVLTQTLAVNEAKNIVSAFNYAVRLMELPQGVVGVSLATYLLAELSGLAAEKKFPEFRAALREGLMQLVFINTLATVLLLVLAEPMIRLLFQHGKFTAEDTFLSAQALWMLAPGLLAFSLNSIYSRAFYALGDTKTPMRISVVCLAVNVVLAFFLIPLFRQAGMGLANTVSAVLNTALLVFALRRKLPKFTYEGLSSTVLVLGSAGLLAGVLAWGWSVAGQHWWGVERYWARGLTVFGAIGVASGAYFGVCWWRGLTPAREMVRLVRSRVGRGKLRAES
ncbi:MAG: murein biosynthesis integral membrane protein MurJ [Verrucomicrobia bacterium]|nr:murein biosynthesis integral membrane protein MurJ [Verrucomicrobiota bacterium]